MNQRIFSGKSRAVRICYPLQIKLNKNMTKIKEKQGWTRIGNSIYPKKNAKLESKLPSGIYSVGMDGHGNLYIEHEKPKFEFPYKVYDLDNKFVERVKKTFENVDKNVGIMLTGLKGTGKTVMAENICNKLDLPVLLIQFYFEGLPELISSFQQNVVLFFDEYEKLVSKDKDFSILGLMDGVLNNEFKKLFLMTSNNLFINDNLVARPSRIRYIKTFSNLDLPIIIEIIDDLLVNKNHKDVLIDYISSLEIITVDIVKAVIEECNIHDSPPVDFQDFFNVQKAHSKLYNIYKFENKKPVLWIENCNIDRRNILSNFKRKLINCNFEVSNSEICEDYQILDVFEDGLFDIKPSYTDGKAKFKVKIEEIVYRHTSFKDYAF
jgi:hypothetical protein